MTQDEITGRDNYITGQALVYAIAAIQSLPEERQEHSNMLDMCDLARATFEPTTLAHVVAGVEHHTQESVDLHFPQGDEQTAEDVIYENDYLCEMAAIRKQRAALVKQAVDDFKVRTGIGDVSATQTKSAQAIAEAVRMRAGATLH